MRSPLNLILLAGITGLELLSASVPNAHFRITRTTAVPDPTEFGINVHIPSTFYHWKGSGKVNVWSEGGHPEGFSTVVKGVATGGDARTLEHTKRPWASYWGTYRDGFFDGATIRIYRYEDDRAVLLREDRVERFEGGKDESANRFLLASSGPPVRAGDEYVVTREALSSGPGFGEPQRKASPLISGRPHADNSETLALEHEERSLLAEFYRPYPEETTVVLDDTTAAPTGGSASLKVDLQSAGGISIRSWYPEPKSPGWVRFDPDATFTFDGWFKQSEPGRGELLVRCGALAEKRFSLGTDWQRIRFEFRGGEADNARNTLDFELTAPGTLWVDNFLVYESGPDAPPPFGFYPEMIQALREMRPGFLRIWQLQNNKGSVPPFRKMVGGYFEQPWVFDVRKLETFNMIDLHPMLELCAKIDADPWIIVSPFYSEQDWADITEYLAGPADSPMGAIRAKRGRIAPWTDAFENIWLEAGNETWNRAFRPQNFPNRPADYARYADLKFAAAISSPYFDPEKMHFVANGFIGSIDGFTRTVATTASHADFVDIANYIGGWEAGGTDTGTDGEVAYQSRLLYGVTEGQQIVDSFRDLLNSASAERDSPLNGAVYEAGPGYSLPGPDVDIDWDEQHLGKSLASAIGTLDQYFNYTRSGIGPIGHFTFGRGLYWYSHAESTSEWRPHAVTLALRLRNEFGYGDLLEVQAVEVPTIDVPERTMLRKRNDGTIRERPLPAQDDVPLVGCHAFREGDRFALFLISRRFDGATSVQVELPWMIDPKVTVARLSGDSPMAHNTDEDQVRIERTETSNLDFGAIHLPPHSVQVIAGRILQ